MNTSSLPERGEIWQVDFAPTIGAEITKIRPAVVVNIPEAGRLPLRIVVPITDWKQDFEHFFWFIRIVPSSSNGLSKLSGADCFQVKSLSVKPLCAQDGQPDSATRSRNCDSDDVDGWI